MAALTRPGGSTRNPRFRDKRYTIPVLSVDLFTATFSTHFWSPQAILIHGYTGSLAVGDECSGAVSYDLKAGFGLFEARVRKRLPSEQIVMLDMLSLSPEGLRLMAENEMQPRPDGGQQRPLRVSFTHNTVNWSLTGMQLDGVRTPVEPGQMFNGLIRLPRGVDAGTFNATVVRRLGDATSLRVAFRFTSLPEATFALLEAAIKKSG